MIYEISLSELKKAIILIDNEALRLRDQIMKTGENSDKKKQKKLYNLKNRVLSLLEKQTLFYSTGYYKQRLNGKEYRVFINELRGENDDTIIYSVKRHKIKNKKYQLSVEYKGTVGLIEPQDIKSNLGLKEAIKTIKRYITIVNNKSKNYIKDKKNEKTVIHPKIIETKMVELSKLKVVRDVHINGWLNPITFKHKKEELKKKISENKGNYPKEEAILVHKLKDSEDKRRIVYNIEDGYRRFLLSEELGLDKVYVDIIDEQEYYL